MQSTGSRRCNYPVESVNDWIDIRGLRNVIVHEYSDDDLEKIFLKMLKYAPLLQDLRHRLANHEA